MGCSGLRILLRWSFHLKDTGPIGYKSVLYPGLAPTQGIVADLLSRLPGTSFSRSWLSLFMDNLFSTPELFKLLRSQGIAATGTARLGRIDSQQMSDLKVQDRSKDFVAWGTLYARKHKEKEVMQFAFKDNALVLALSTHFSGWELSTWRIRRQPGKTSTSARTARVPFNGQPLKMLQIPCLIDAYNHHMNGVDNGDQLRAEFEPSRRIKRGGQQALIYLFLLGMAPSPYFSFPANSYLEVAITNTFLLQREGWPTTSTVRCKHQTAFHLALCNEMLSHYGKQVALYNSGATCIPDAIPIQNAGEMHSKVHWGKLGWCACCSSRRQKFRLAQVETKVVQKHRSRKGCLECGVPLCTDCWDIWHLE